jgi:hypothetical protein
MDNRITSLIINIGVALLAIIGIILVISAMGNEAVIDPITRQATSDTANVSTVVNFSMGIILVTLGAIAIFTVISIITNPKRFIPTAIGIVVFALLMLVAYSMVTVESTGDIMLLEGATDSNLEWGGLGIQATFVLVIVAVGLIIAQSVRGLIGYFTK